MTGYQEVLTDPSYVGQMVCMTYPHIGNYGVNLDDVESDRIRVEAFIVKECCKAPSNWRAKETLPDYLTRHNVVGIEGIDTRALTRHLRLHGAQRGIISTECKDPADLVKQARDLPTMEGLGLADLVTPKEPYILGRKSPEKSDLGSGRFLCLARHRPARRGFRLRHKMEHPAPAGGPRHRPARGPRLPSPRNR